MDKCDKCDDKATILVEGYLYARYVCSLHASKIAQLIGAPVSDVERIREYAGVSK
jgi:hypothetical protein